MHKFRVAIVYESFQPYNPVDSLNVLQTSGGGISGVCLAGALSKHGDIQVDLYEASDNFDEVGAGITLWGRVCEALRLMGLSDDCIKAAVVAASTSDLPTSMFYICSIRIGSQGAS